MNLHAHAPSRVQVDSNGVEASSSTRVYLRTRHHPTSGFHLACFKSYFPLFRQEHAERQARLSTHGSAAQPAFLPCEAAPPQMRTGAARARWEAAKAGKEAELQKAIIAERERRRADVRQLRRRRPSFVFWKQLV